MPLNDLCEMQYGHSKTILFLLHAERIDENIPWIFNINDIRNLSTADELLIALMHYVNVHLIQRTLTTAIHPFNVTLGSIKHYPVSNTHETSTIHSQQSFVIAMLLHMGSTPNQTIHPLN